MYKNFFYLSIFDKKKFTSYLPKKKNIILDYGCGNGIFTSTDVKSKKIKLIKMFDKDKNLKEFIKNKYKKNKKINWSNNLKTGYNVALINSVIQYMQLKEYKELINFFFLKKTQIIIISDIPKYPRIIEIFLLLLKNKSHFFKIFKYIFNKKYLKLKYFFHKKDELLIKNINYKYKIQPNLNNLKFLRYTLIFKRKII